LGRSWESDQCWWCSFGFWTWINIRRTLNLQGSYAFKYGG
jgi:hypothetical protein